MGDAAASAPKWYAPVEMGFILSQSDSSERACRRAAAIGCDDLAVMPLPAR